ncbi:MAG: hypothetical protein A2Z29_02130, partial [Chloroflexi bacterium RBG_16_56_11]
QTAGVEAEIAGADTSSAMITLSPALAYKTKLLSGLKTLDRFTVQAINPHALEGAELATFKVTVTTSSGTYTDTVNITADLPYAISTGLANVAVGIPVLLSSDTQAAYSWNIVPPTGSKAALTDSKTRNPSFTPDVAGKYTLTEGVSKAVLSVYAGTWEGAITGQDANGRPVAAGCTACHNGQIAPDNFTAWKESGHAEIFTQNINNPAGHWSFACASCHSVGYDGNNDNGGFDAAVAATGWKPPASGAVGLWTDIIAKYPTVAKAANIQCENCHGPNNGSTLHANGVEDAARLSISSDVCGTCHGEPARHGRYQQWEESGHANFELALDEATVETRGAFAGYCGRCHSAQGFLAWIQQSDLTKQIQGANGNATVAELTALGLTKATVQPQTCAVCHDPHDVGNLSGEPNTAKVRIVDNTSILPAGFQAKTVGKGATCMTCHNTRNALHNIDAPPTSYSAPHVAAQADVLMGENAYLVAPSQRSPHSYVKDTCVTCHMESTPPPAEFSYNLSGTNHSFAASIEICADCHSSAFNGEALQIGVEDKLEELGEEMAAYLLGKLPASVTVKDYTPHAFGGKNYDVKSNAVVIEKTNIASLAPTEPHGQQGFLFTLTNPVNVTYAPAGETVHTITVTVLEVQLGDVTTDGTTKVIAATDPFVQVGWNYFLIHGDNSKGVHNPAFVNEVLDASLEALK